MRELGKDGIARVLEQEAICESLEEVIKIYGLKEPDILDYDINEISK